MEENKIRIGITQGDINGVGYEVILKTFADPLMFDLCTPIVYGSPKVAAYHRKSLDLSTNFSIVSSATEAADGRLNVVNCTNDEVKVEFSKADAEAGKAALDALEKAIEEYRNGLVDVIVTAPINKHTIHSEQFAFPGHTEYIEQRLGDGGKALMILMKDDFRVALVTGHIPVSQIPDKREADHIQPFSEARFRHQCPPHCRLLAESPCGRRRSAGHGGRRNHHSRLKGDERSGCAVLWPLSGRWLYGLGQLHPF